MKVEVWSDVVCPWCYLGKRRLESALERFEHGDEVEVSWRSFELDPSAPRQRSLGPKEHLARKYRLTDDQVEASWARLTALAEAEGLEPHLDRTRGGSSFDAHRVLHLAAAHGLQGAVKEWFLRAFFTESLPLGDPEMLEALAVEAGLPRAEVADVVATARFAEAVRNDERLARLHGIDGVPFFAVNDRFGVSGAQSADVLLEVLEATWAARLESAS